MLVEMRHAEFAWKAIASGAFDVVHVHHAAALPFTRFVARPTVATVHHDRAETFARHYESYRNVAYVAISRRQRELSPRVPFRAVIHHGLAVDGYPEGSGSGGYCAFLGRLAQEKGPHFAIEAATRAGVPIRIGGEAHAGELAYFEREVRPRLGSSLVDWLGEVGGARKLSLLSDARCLLFPVQWEEPFGLVMIESMLVGTPVIAFSQGSVPEVIDEGVTGYLVASVEEMTERLRTIDSLDRKRCRARARERWSAYRMARDYLEVYRRTIAPPSALKERRRGKSRCEEPGAASCASPND